VRIDRARTAGLLLALVAVAGACATPTDPHWTDDGIHVVDGHWVPTEHPCDLASADTCVTAVRAAEASLAIDPHAVAGAATARLPRRWVRSDGQTVYVNPSYSGSPPEFVIVDLANGSRRVTGYGCWGVPNEDGTMNCGAVPLDQFRVGHSPLD
jgi:hypothetical protein